MSCKENLEFNPMQINQQMFGNKLRACTGLYMCPGASDNVIKKLQELNPGLTVTPHEPSKHKNQGTYPNNPLQQAYQKALARNLVHVSPETGHAVAGPCPKAA
ncbi:MAG: hypothetical protein V1810_00020 [Candidatus Beckwithbacteria bacterium]